MTENNPQERAVPLVYVWWSLAVIPAIVILVSFILGGWSWGLMDDYGFLSFTGGFWDRFSHIFKTTMDFGSLRPTSTLYYVIFYKMFSHNPTGFYIVRWLTCVLALGVWAFLAFKATRSRFAAPLFLFAALSFYKVYDAFFYLSTQEILGVLSFGFSFLFFWKAVEQRLENAGGIDWKAFAVGFGFLLLTFASKEPFLAVGMALGISSIIVSVWDRKKEILWPGICGIVMALGHAIFLKSFLMPKGRSTQYALTDIGFIWGNVVGWFQRDLPCHAPWIIFAGIVLFLQRGASRPTWTRVRWWVFLTGVFAYFGYTGLLLPWDTWGHYVTPLGIFFAFSLSVLLADRLDGLKFPQSMMIALLSFIFALIVGMSALKFQVTYQYDTANLMKWMGTNGFFDHEMGSGAIVRGNALEAGETVMKQVNAVYGKNYPGYIFTSNVREVLADAKTRYYLWAPHYGDQDLNRLKGMWTSMFVSEHWVLFRRMY